MSTTMAMSARPDEAPTTGLAARDAPCALLELRLSLAEQSSLAAALQIAGLACPAPLPQDVIGFLLSAVYFSAAVARLDGSDERELETMCYEQLADLKRKLNEITLQRALE